MSTMLSVTLWITSSKPPAVDIIAFFTFISSAFCEALARSTLTMARQHWTCFKPPVASSARPKPLPCSDGMIIISSIPSLAALYCSNACKMHRTNHQDTIITAMFKRILTYELAFSMHLSLACIWRASCLSASIDFRILLQDCKSCSRSSEMDCYCGSVCTTN